MTVTCGGGKNRDKNLASARLDGIEVSLGTLELIDQLDELNVPVERQIAIILGCNDTCSERDAELVL